MNLSTAFVLSALALTGPGDARPLDHAQADPARSDYHQRGPGLDPGRDQRRANAGRDGAAQEGRDRQRQDVGDRDRRDCRHDGALAEAADVPVLVDRRAAAPEDGRAIRQAAVAPPEDGAQQIAAAPAVLADPAGSSHRQEDPIAGPRRHYPRPDRPFR